MKTKKDSVAEENQKLKQENSNLKIQLRAMADMITESTSKEIVLRGNLIAKSIAPTIAQTETKGNK